MKGNERRNQILIALNKTLKPTSATKLAKDFLVSRQVIVGDVALLRALGHDILSTPKGYLLNKEDKDLNTTQVIVKHTIDETENELQIFVNNKIIVKDVIINHKVYGIITGELNIKTMDDVNNFLNSKPQLLAKLTDGIHIHTLLYKDETNLDNAIKELKEANYLYED